LVDLLGPQVHDPESMRAFSVVVENCGTQPRPTRQAAFAASFRHYVENSPPAKDLPPISEIIRGKPCAHKLTRPLTEKVRASLQHARSWIEKRNQKKDAIAHFARERFMKGVRY
jgi:hypothetical protein